MLISIKANCIDSTAPPEQVFAAEVEKLRQEKFFPKEQLTLEPYERDHAVSTTPARLNNKRQDRSLTTTNYRWSQLSTGRRISRVDLIECEVNVLSSIAIS